MAERATAFFYAVILAFFLVAGAGVAALAANSDYTIESAPFSALSERL